MKRLIGRGHSGPGGGRASSGRARGRETRLVPRELVASLEQFMNRGALGASAEVEAAAERMGAPIVKALLSKGAVPAPP